MSMQPVNPDERFEFDKADRLRRAMRVSGVSVQTMAEHLQVDRNTIGNWISGRANPRPRDLRTFAMRTGFPIQWLETGIMPTDGDGNPAELPKKITNRLLALGSGVPALAYAA